MLLLLQYVRVLLFFWLVCAVIIATMCLCMCYCFWLVCAVIIVTMCVLLFLVSVRCNYCYNMCVCCCFFGQCALLLLLQCVLLFWLVCAVIVVTMCVCYWGFLVSVAVIVVSHINVH